MKKLIAVSAVVFALGGCATTDNTRHIVNIDQTLELQSESFEIVKARRFWAEDQLNISAGPYRVTGADKGWMHSSTVGKFDWTLFTPGIDNKHVSHEQRVRFTLNKHDGSQWYVRCEKRGNGDFTEFSFGHHTTMTQHEEYYQAYQCEFRSNDAQWDLVMEHSNRFGIKAYFKTPEDQFFNVESFFESSSHPMENGPAGRFGYYLESDGDNVAAVSTLPLGQLWLNQNQPETMRDSMAMAAVGLWFYHNGFDEPVIDHDS